MSKCALYVFFPSYICSIINARMAGKNRIQVKQHAEIENIKNVGNNDKKCKYRKNKWFWITMVFSGQALYQALTVYMDTFNMTRKLKQAFSTFSKAEENN